MVGKEEQEDLKALLEQGKIKEAKTLLRSQSPSDIASTWKTILWHHTRNSPVDTASIYWDTVDTCFGGRDLADCKDRTPNCVDANHLPSYGQGDNLKAEICRLVTCLAYNSPDITYSPLLYPCAALLRLHLSEEETYSALNVLIEPPKGMQFLTQSRRSWEIMCQSLYPLSQKFVKKRISKIESMAEKDQTMTTLSTWPWWIFEYTPVNFIEVMFTCFLLEGHKVLYRFGLALLKSYSKQDNFIANIKDDGFQKSMKKYISSLNVDKMTLLQSGFKIQRFSRTELSKIAVKVDMELKSISNMDGGGLERRRSATEMIAPDAAEEILAVSDTLSYKQLQNLWVHLPERITMVKPKLVFSSNNDGTSLRTFYLKSEYYEPTILIIKTRDEDILGAYCSSSWRERNEKDERGLKQLYFGTGESFLFKIVSKGGEEGDVDKFGWVGEQDGGRADRASQLFMSGDDTMISIGGGEGTGIYMDQNMEYGRTENCKTFDNPPLASSKDFKISVVEVIGFNDTRW